MFHDPPVASLRDANLYFLEITSPTKKADLKLAFPRSAYFPTG
jgi:hypothetical protein